MRIKPIGTNPIVFKMAPKMPPYNPNNDNKQSPSLRSDTTQSPSFGYSNQLKTLWRKGKLPTVKYGFYGDELTQKNISLEHLQPHSQGGRTEIDNLVLSSKQKNWARGADPLSQHISFAAMGKYLDQFKDVVVDGFNGNKYITSIINKVNSLLLLGY